MRFAAFYLPLLATAWLTNSCSSAPFPGGPDVKVTQSFDAEGGTMEVAGAVILFPKGALGEKTTISVAVSGASTIPADYVGLSKLFTFEPTGASFALPLEIRLPFTDDGGGGTLHWSKGDEPTFADLGGRVEGAVLIASVSHFSSGFVGRKK